jgi:hypothetical protein
MDAAESAALASIWTRTREKSVPDQLGPVISRKHLAAALAYHAQDRLGVKC